MDIKLKIFRFDPDVRALPYYQTYSLPWAGALPCWRPYGKSTAHRTLPWAFGIIIAAGACAEAAS